MDNITNLTNFHNSENKRLLTKHYEKLTPRDFKIIREVANISVKSNRHSHEPFGLIRYFEESGLNKKLIREIKQKGIRLPSPIQMQAIPLSLKWKDLIGVAPTGSGKTLAFTIPLINFLLTMPAMNSERAVQGPYAIVLGTYGFNGCMQENNFNPQDPHANW